MDIHKATPSHHLKIHLLGQFLVFICGHAVPESAIKGRKARSLLKLIALQRNCQVVRDHAMDALWPDLDAAAAASQLYKALHHIRKAFDLQYDGASEWIEITDDLIMLAPPGPIVTDIRTFEQSARAGLRNQDMTELETAASVYAGDLLPMDFYAEWASLPREHYRQLYLDVLIALARRYEARGELSEAAEMLRLALEKDPVLETAHRGLMRIFARRGQPTRALRQYELCRDVLRRDLDMEPSFETREVLADVREGRTSEKIDAGALRATIPAPTPPIVGRSAECAEIERALARLSAGEGGVMIIRGSVGLGKTRLIRELALKSRRQGRRVFLGGASEGEGAVTYAPFIQIFDSVLHEHPDLWELLPLEIGRLVPSFSGDGAIVPHADKLAAKGYLFAQVHRFFTGLAEADPAVVILEDLHAADKGSRELFDYLIRHRMEGPILFVATVRDEDSRPSRATDSPIHDGAAAVLKLQPLTPDEHAQLIQQFATSSAIPSQVADRIFQLSEGNPLFALELLRFQAGNGAPAASDVQVETGIGRYSSFSGSIPPSLRNVVEQRLAELSPLARHTLYIAAVIGRHVRYDVMSAVSRSAGSPEEAGLFAPLEEVTRAGLLEERGLDYLFRHALVREAIYESISEARRRALHGLIANHLVSASGDKADEPVETIAHHFIRAGEIRQGVHYLVLAGERAEAAYAHEDALQRFGEALEALEDLNDSTARRIKHNILEHVGDVYRACGKLEQSYDAYENAVALAEDVPLSDAALVELHRKIALVAIFKTEIERSEKHLELGFNLAGGDVHGRARLLIIKALQFWHLNRLEDARNLAHEALELAESIQKPDVASQACEILAMACLPLGRWEEGLNYEMKRQVYGWSPEIVVATDAHLCLWEYHVSGNQPFQKARAFMQSVAEQASRLGDLRCVAVCHYALGTMHLWRGESQTAADELDASLALHERVGSPAGMAYALARKGVLHTMRGATELGWQAVQEGITYAQQAAVRDHCLQRLYGVGIWNRLEADDLTGTRSLVDKSTELLDDTGACAACALELFPWMAYYYLRSGDITRAQECGAAVSELAAMTGNPVGRAVAAMIESSLSVTGQSEERARQLRLEAFEFAKGAVSEATHSPVVHYLDRMVDQQATLRFV